MRLLHAVCPLVIVLAGLCAGPAARGEVTGLTRVATGFSDPTFVAHAPGDADRMFVVEQSGRIRIFDRQTGVKQVTTFLDIAGPVERGHNEKGLLGLAFHPDFQTNGKFYVNYTRDADETRGETLDQTQVDEYTAKLVDGELVADLEMRVPILNFAQDFDNHNGGWLGFSPNDGMLYISTGDGGSGNDPNNRGQSLNTRLGKMLRIDVNDDDFTSDPDENYAVPEGNPFSDDGDANTLAEIWAYGLRNPWRASFDRVTGDLWIGDVGQGAREEIDFQAADSSGGENYGWRLREGDIQTPDGVGGPEPADYVGPVYDYSHGNGSFQGISVVGGYRYRGPDPDVNGRYFFADSYRDHVWSFNLDGPDADSEVDDLTNLDSLLAPDVGNSDFPTSFGEDLYGNLYIVARGGDIFRIETDATLTGDYNLDRMVSELDYDVWKESFGSTTSLAADGNGDGMVNLADYVVWRNNLGAEIGGGQPLGALQVPEPSAVISLLASLLVGVLVTRTHASTC